MKAVILAGGLGTRISEETHLRPKPMIEIGGKPILWHIMKIYSAHGVNDFVICCGYKGYVIKEYFANYFLHMSDVTFDMANNRCSVHQQKAEPWRVTLVDTGEDTMTGGRLKRVARYVERRAASASLTATASSDMDIRRRDRIPPEPGQACDGHGGRSRRAATARSSCQGARVTAFMEKPRGDGGLINGGFFVLSPRCSTCIDGDAAVGRESRSCALRAMAQMMAFEHRRLLAADGHAARQDDAGRAVGLRQGAMENMAVTAAPRAEFWRGKSVLVTGHTGFKGSWLALGCTGSAQR